MSDITLVEAVALKSNAAQLRRAPHLIVLKDGNKKKLFITLDAPVILQNFVQAKGIYTDVAEDDVPEKFVEVLTNAGHELVLEVWHAAHTVVSMRSLVFKAKPGK